MRAVVDAAHRGRAVAPVGWRRLASATTCAWGRAPTDWPTGSSISAPQAAIREGRLRITPDYVRLKHTMRDLDLVTVCEEAGCPNIFECWSDGTATFMINGERCTRACGFCLVDTSQPRPARPGGEPDARGRGGRPHGAVVRRGHRRRP